VSDWFDACDPVPERREDRRLPHKGAAESYQRGAEHRARLAASMRRKNKRSLEVETPLWVLDSDFDEMGA